MVEKKWTTSFWVKATIAVFCAALSSHTTYSGYQTAQPQILAHRGLGQTFDIKTVKADTNTAAIIYPPEHAFLENTIQSMKAAFDYGADIVEIDIRVTKDKELAVFHDYLVEFRTEKSGKVSDYTREELKKMDIGYGYTHDGGETYPLRGTGVGLLPSFDEMMKEFPGREFLVHTRDGGREISEILLEKLSRMDETEIKHILIYGNDEAIKIIRNEFPAIKAFTVKLMKPAILVYAAIGWTGIAPRKMHNLEIHLPIEYARFRWGWPVKLIKRLERVNTRFVIVRKQGPWSGGFDTLEELKVIPEEYCGVIWVDRTDRIGGYYLRSKD